VGVDVSILLISHPHPLNAFDREAMLNIIKKLLIKLKTHNFNSLRFLSLMKYPPSCPIYDFYLNKISMNIANKIERRRTKRIPRLSL